MWLRLTLTLTLRRNGSCKREPVQSQLLGASVWCSARERAPLGLLSQGLPIKRRAALC